MQKLSKLYAKVIQILWIIYPSLLFSFRIHLFHTQSILRNGNQRRRGHGFLAAIHTSTHTIWYQARVQKQKGCFVETLVPKRCLTTLQCCETVQRQRWVDRAGEKTVLLSYSDPPPHFFTFSLRRKNLEINQRINLLWPPI